MLKAIDEISKKNNEANKLLPEFQKIDKKLDKAEIVCTKTDATKYNFNIFALPLKFIKKIYNYEITYRRASGIKRVNKQTEWLWSKNFKKIEEKNRVLESAGKLLDVRDDIIDLFEKGTFPYTGNVFKTKEE